MSSFFSRPNDLDCGGFPRSARSVYKGKSGTVLWINQRNWIFYNSNGNWVADHLDNPDSFLGNRDLVEVPEMSFTSGITRQCLGNVFDEDETLRLKEENEKRHFLGRRKWPEFVRTRPDQSMQNAVHKSLTRRIAMKMDRGGRSRRNIKKNKSKRRRSRKTIRRRRR